MEAVKIKKVDQLSINTIRMLAIDMVEKAKSGHPGLPLGAAPMAYVLFALHMNHDPSDSKWHNRDRFVLSAGHGCALLYSILHLCGYRITMDDLKQFRQFGSVTPGHPEYGLTDGVEATTGPLGQGFAMGVGMAAAERLLGDCFNSADEKIIDHHTYGIISDGDLMEGISSEAASLAGTMGLGKLIYLYDDNHISIEGDTSLAFTENVKQRFEAYGWHAQKISDGNDIEAISRAVEKAKEEDKKPSIIIVRTNIGHGSPGQGTAAVHGEPLGREGLKKTKEFYGFDPGKTFFVPKEVYGHFMKAAERGLRRREEWKAKVSNYKNKYPEQAELLDKYLRGNINPELEKNTVKFSEDDGPLATRAASEKVMNNIEKYMTEFTGGSADLSPSTKTYLHGYGDIGVAGGCARNLHFGVREHAMGGIINGMALHGGVIPYSATFLSFSDYMRPPIRLAALMKIHSIFVFTHDSIGLGEDGPTHQPVEHLNSLRMIPGLTVMRPADANETSAAWNYAVTHKQPFVLAFSRQKLPVLDHEKYGIFEGVPKGGYTLIDEKNPDVIIIATGSEVSIALSATEKLKEKKIKAKVVSMVSYEIFIKQEKKYRDSILIPGVKKLVVEAGSPVFWQAVIKNEGEVLGVEKFGASAPGGVVMGKYGFTVENIIRKAELILGKGQ